MSKRWHERAMLQSSGSMSLAELWQALHELADVVTEKCDGQWYAKRSDIAKWLHGYAEHLARAPWARQTQERP